MHRFFISLEQIEKGTITIVGSQARQLRDVLRLKPGAQIVVLDNTGWEYLVDIVDITPDKVCGKVIEHGHCPNEPGTKITLYQALLKGNKFDFVLQKCTELGVSSFVPVLCERCVATEVNQSRFQRWHKIIVEAAEQSGRGNIPTLHPLVDFGQACELTEGLSLLPWEAEADAGIKAVLQDRAWGKSSLKLNVFVGPEGGFAPHEVELARSKMIVPVSLGKRILRAETAGLVTASAILYEYDEMDCKNNR
ncbi:MAG: RsmE family RNA methyltransferase [Thermodesulfobacteriota bacterium]|nr:RsmE family RNA methyltransferase [Thermodesulfobacteriota bacterium]